MSASNNGALVQLVDLVQIYKLNHLDSDRLGHDVQNNLLRRGAKRSELAGTKRRGRIGKSKRHQPTRLDPITVADHPVADA